MFGQAGPKYKLPVPLKKSVVAEAKKSEKKQKRKLACVSHPERLQLHFCMHK